MIIVGERVRVLHLSGKKQFDSETSICANDRGMNTMEAVNVPKGSFATTFSRYRGEFPRTFPRCSKK
jgi:hypothetical protein